MQEKHNEDAKWDDLDWGQIEPEPAAMTSGAEAPVVVMKSPVAPAAVTLDPPLGMPAQPPTVPAPPNVESPADEPQHPPAAPTARGLDSPVSEPQQRASAPAPPILETSSEEPEQPQVQTRQRPQPPWLQAGQRPQPPRINKESRPLSAQSPKRSKSSPEAYVFAPSSVATLMLPQLNGKEGLIITVTDQFMVGRHANNNLVIKDLGISNHHAKFVCHSDGTFWIEDLNSKGGTYVNGQRVDRQALKSGDEVSFSAVVTTFHYVAGPCLDNEMPDQHTVMYAQAHGGKQMPPPMKQQKQAALITLDGVKQGLPFCGEVSVGRLPENDIVIDEIHVSKLHARLVGFGDGMFQIIDLQSTSGTYVNEELIQTKALTHGDKVRFGLAVFVFEIV